MRFDIQIENGIYNNTKISCIRFDVDQWVDFVNLEGLKTMTSVLFSFTWRQVFELNIQLLIFFKAVKRRIYGVVTFQRDVKL